MSRIPKFKSDKEEAHFWDTHSATDFLDQLKEVKEPLFIRPTKRTASIRLENAVVQKIRSIAQEKGLNYTTLIRTWVLEKLKQEQHSVRTTG